MNVGRQAMLMAAVINDLMDLNLADSDLKAVAGRAGEVTGLDPTEELGGGGAAVAGSTSGVPRDPAKLKAFVSEGEWFVNRRGRPKAFRTDKKGNPADPGYCQGTKTGSCGDDFPSLDTPYAYRKQNQPGGAATICLPCFEVAGGVETPYVPKQQDTAPVVAEDEELPF